MTRSVLSAMREAPPDGLIVQTHSPLVVEALDLLVPLADACSPSRSPLDRDRPRPSSPASLRRRAPIESAVRGGPRSKAAGLRVVITVSPLLPISDPGRLLRAHGRIRRRRGHRPLQGRRRVRHRDSGSRTLRTALPAAMAAVDPESISSNIATDGRGRAAILPGRVGVGREGFAGRFLESTE